MLFVMLQAFSAHATVIPYLPAMQNFGGSTADLATFFPSTGSYTLEVQGTVGVQISVANGVYNYTPTTNGVVRFSQKNGKVYVYEGNVYKTTLTPNAAQATYPNVYDDANLSNINNAENLIVNPGFETTTGANLGTTDQRYAAATWIPTGGHTSYTSGGIRVNVDNASYVTGRESLATLLWRNDGAGVNNTTTYLYQSLGTKLKPNTIYKIKFHVLTHNQARSCNWRVGVGSTSGGYEYSLNVFNTPNTNFTSRSYEYTFQTPSVVASETFFTIGNNGDATSSTWTIIHLDRITLAEGSVTKGITGVTSATFLDGTAYAPANLAVDFANGDYIDYTSEITNPSFETNSFTGWTNTGFSIVSNSPLYVKDGIYHIEKYLAPVATIANMSVSQTVTGLPNGKYVLSASGLARKNQNGTGPTDIAGAVLFAGNASTPVSTAGSYSAEAIVTDGTLSIGFKVENAPTGTNWVSVDNFKLSYLGVIPSLVTTQSSILYSVASTPSNATISLTGSNLTSDITLTVPSTHITLSGDNVTGTSPTYTIALANANALNTITATWDKAANVSGDISITSGTASKTVSVTSDDIETVAVSGISLSAGGLTPRFEVGTTVYSVKAPADVNSVSITATTTPSVATVTNNGSSISASVPSIDLTGNSYNGNAHTSAYTITWNGNYTINDWAAGGTNTDAVLSVPTVYGWSANPTITWVAANSTQSGTVRYMDMVNGANTGIGGITYTYNGNNYGGRIMFVRWDGGNVARIYSYPVALETGITYQLTGKAAWNSVDVAPTLTLNVNSAKDNTGTSAGTAATVVTSTAGLLTDISNNSFTVPSTGIYYLNITSSTPSLCAIADLSIVGTPTSLDSNTSNLYVSSNKGQLTVHGTQAGDVVNVYNMSGMLINKFAATSNTSVLNLKQGAYFVKVNDNVMKAIIK